MTEEPNRCPKCNGEGVPIIYGYVPQTEPGGEKPEIVQEQERGELVLGGCVGQSCVVMQELQPALRRARGFRGCRTSAQA